MTRDAAIAFLTDAGHLVEVEDFDDTYACIAFKYRGTSVKWFTNADDPDFVCLVCSYALGKTDAAELPVARVLADVALNLKVVKLTADLEARWVAASAEQFLPPCDGFERIFWRSVELVIHAVRRAHYDIHALEFAADGAAERFTRQMESELQLNGDS